MPHARSPSPFWDRAGEQEAEAFQKTHTSDLTRNLKGLFKKAISPNQPDPSDPVINGASRPSKASFVRNVIADLATQAPRIGANMELISSLIDTKILDGGIVDDRSYQMERIIELVASLPERSGAQDDLGGKFIQLLWNNLEHPPLSKLGDAYRYRMADGSNNNLMYPHLGKAGSSYTRTVSPQTQQPGVLPDAGLVFDAIFARDEHPQEHPNKISSMLFHWATIIIHDIFHTDERDSTKVKTSSYLDLAPLYGSSEEELARVRQFQDGLLKPDTFCEGRVLAFPPGVAALLVCFNRYHNYVAMQLKIINERGRFTPPDDENDVEALKRLDNDLFQTARLVTCGLYVNIILTDYVRTILNLNRANTTWTLDPRDDFVNIFNEKGTPEGIGNDVSVEFNLIYRWHSAVSRKDEKWTRDAYQTIFPNQEVSSLTEQQFKLGMRKWLGAQGSDPSGWNLNFEKYKRTARGTFRDQDLVNILTEATGDVACAFGARQVPIGMKLIEVMGINQARRWNVCTLNEFRKFFKLRPYTSFSQISSDPEVAHALRALYKDPDYVELYPGVVAEDAKRPMSPGSGLCPGYTASRAILADAVSLVRGDRFYTVDFSPANLTNWGFTQIKSDGNVAQGHVIHNLIMRALPNYYRGNSVYAMFPFVVPSENRKILHQLHKDHEYSFAAPEFIPVPLATKSYAAATRVLVDQQNFHVPWGAHTAVLVGSDKYPYMLSVDNERGQAQREAVQTAIYGSSNSMCPVDGMQQVRQFYEALTTQLIEIHSERLYGTVHQLDACRDVANPSHAIFTARLWHIPLKGPGDKTFGVEVDKLYLALSVAFAYVFLDGDTAKSFKLRDAAKRACTDLTDLIKLVCGAVKLGQSLPNVSRLFEMGHQGEVLAQYGSRLIKRLYTDDRTLEEVVSIILPTAAASVATQAQHFTNLLDVYLSEPYTQHWADIRNCAWSDDPADFEKLKMYALEANRLKPAAYGLLRHCVNKTTIDDDGQEITVDAGTTIYLNFVSAGRDPKVFPDPLKIDITRGKSLYIHQGWGPHSCVGREIVENSMAVQLKVFAKLKNLRRAPGPQGQMKSTMPAPNPVSSDPVPNPGGVTVYMKEDWSDWWPFPTTLKVHHDGFYESQEQWLGMETGLPHRQTDIDATRVANGDTNGLAPDIKINGISTEPHTNGINGVADTNGVTHVNGVPHTNGLAVTNGVSDTNSVTNTNGVTGANSLNGVDSVNNLRAETQDNGHEPPTLNGHV